IPKDIVPGKYLIKASVYYSNLEQKSLQASSIAYISVQYPFFKRKLFGISMGFYFGGFLFILLIIEFIFLRRWLENNKKRFKVKVEFNKLPSFSSSSIFIGKVAETEVRTFLDLNKLQMHTLIAGSTGSGKTIVAQGIIEEALLHKKSVVVFDPTAQWTGFFKPSEDRKMLNRYKYFEMKVKDVRGFNGTIKTIRDPYELIHIEDYMNKPGEITIFDISGLSPSQIDLVVASTIEQIFKSQPEESRDLRTLLVYDEVHRLLPKFGGSGKGFIQLERGAREFRKWGVGLILISQVLSDFIGEIKANIGTEIQMGTRYEGDLERISMKYGEDILKSVVREPIGTGMVVNAEYNSGKPYFVSFRPLLHSTKGLSKIELKKYEEYFEKIEDLEFQISRLEHYGVDTFDLKLELKIAKDKVKTGQFQMVDIYLESLVPSIANNWKELKKSPEHLVKKKISSSDVLGGISKGEKDREKYIQENNKNEEFSLDEELKKIKFNLAEKKRRGKNTVNLELKLKEFEEKLKSLDQKFTKEDLIGIKKELNSLIRDLNKL
ncbi:ATP-binding protein, partial [Candidatus Woesearchaeota archaeon]|nr:ATP-binding protein [Candidatus Woesearchaeota archaeon]